MCEHDAGVRSEGSLMHSAIKKSPLKYHKPRDKSADVAELLYASTECATECAQMVVNVFCML